MPPSSQPSEDENGLEYIFPLSNADVAILYEIIITAQQSATVGSHPFRAIFSAYDQIIARHGLSADHDQVYLRFLLRMCGRREARQSFFESFEALLGEHGIQIAFGDEEVHGAQDPSFEGSGLDGEPGGRNIPSRPRGRSRRASFSSFYDVEEESTRISRRRANSRSSLSRIRSSAKPLPENRLATKATTRPAEGSYPQVTPAEVTSRPSSIKGFKTKHSSGPNQLSSSEFPVQQRGKHHTIRGVNQLNGFSNERNVNEDLTESSSGGSEHRSMDPATPLTISYRPSDTQLVRDAGIFQHFRARSVARDSITKWRIIALDAMHRHRVLDDNAVGHDRRILLSQAFEQWRIEFLARRRSAETQRFFDNLERRACRARDLYLLTKAFTHWAQCSSEEVRRTSVARRHILRFRYFNTWLEMTAVNELKIRRQRLRKFFALWRRTSVNVSARVKGVLISYDGNIVQKMYLRWLGSFCESRASEWTVARLKRTFLARLMNGFRSSSEQGLQTQFVYKLKLQHRCYAQWLEKTQMAWASERAAHQFRCQKILRRTVLLWQLQLRQMPLVRQLTRMVNRRLVQSTYSAIVTRCQLTQQAERANRQRVMRNMWKQWNDRLRVQSIARQIDDRLMLQALYKWVMKERFLLLRRLHDERSKRASLRILANHLHRSTDWHHVKLMRILNDRNKKTLQAVFQHWRHQHQVQGQREQLAFDFHTPPIARTTLLSWSTRCLQCQGLYAWSKDATFYFRATRSLRCWQAALVESRKRKRHDAYATVRRTLKMNLARRIIEQWHSRTVQIDDMQNTADQIQQQQFLAFGTALFDRWNDYLHVNLDRSLQIDMQRFTSLATKHLGLWRSRFNNHTSISQQASIFATLHTSKTAHEALRALQLKIFEVRSRTDTAFAFATWNEKRRTRALVRTWREATLRKKNRHTQPAPVASTPFLPSSRAQPPSSNAFRRSRKILPGQAVLAPAEWPEPDHEEFIHGEDVHEEFNRSDWISTLDDKQFPTYSPLLQDLATPSKRAAKARALATPYSNRARAINQSDSDGNGDASGNVASVRTPFRMTTDEKGAPARGMNVVDTPGSATPLGNYSTPLSLRRVVFASRSRLRPGLKGLERPEGDALELRTPGPR